MNEYIVALQTSSYQLGASVMRCLARLSFYDDGHAFYGAYEGFETHMNIDERSASFMALGIARLIKNQLC